MSLRDGTIHTNKHDILETTRFSQTITSFTNQINIRYRLHGASEPKLNRKFGRLSNFTQSNQQHLSIVAYRPKKL